MRSSNFEPDNKNMETQQESGNASEPWTPPQGPIAKAFAWLILIFIAIILLGMLAAVFGT